MKRIPLYSGFLGLCLLVSLAGSARAQQFVNGSFEKLYGGQASFEDYRGRPTVVNWFSSTCIPCQTEMPALEQTKQQLADQVAFIGMDVNDTVEAGRAFAEATRVTWDLGRDPNSAIMQEAGGTLLPTTAILDRDGTIIWLHAGAVDTGDVAAQLRDHHLIS